MKYNYNFKNRMPPVKEGQTDNSISGPGNIRYSRAWTAFFLVTIFLTMTLLTACSDSNKAGSGSSAPEPAEEPLPTPTFKLTPDKEFKEIIFRPGYPGPGPIEDRPEKLRYDLKRSQGVFAEYTLEDAAVLLAKENKFLSGLEKDKDRYIAVPDRDYDLNQATKDLKESKNINYPAEASYAYLKTFDKIISGNISEFNGPQHFNICIFPEELADLLPWGWDKPYYVANIGSGVSFQDFGLSTRKNFVQVFVDINPKHLIAARAYISHLARKYPEMVYPERVILVENKALNDIGLPENSVDALFCRNLHTGITSRPPGMNEEDYHKYCAEFLGSWIKAVKPGGKIICMGFDKKLGKKVDDYTIEDFVKHVEQLSISSNLKLDKMEVIEKPKMSLRDFKVVFTVKK